MAHRSLVSGTALMSALMAVAACSVANDVAEERGGGTVAPATDAVPAEDGGPAGQDAAGGDAAKSPEVTFKIELDYRFDTAGFFADPARKKALEGACRIWGRLIKDSFANVPKGTFIKVRNPEKPTEPAVALTLESEIDDLLLFVGSSNLPSGVTGMASPTAGLSGITDVDLASSLQKRFDGTPFQPWTAWISFDSGTDFYFDPDPESGHAVPSGQLDFVSVALHEIAHTLGFGTADAFASNAAGATFTGTKTKALFGGPLPLTADRSHVPNGTMSGAQRMLMDVSDGAGARYLPTPLDRAVLEDLGFHF